jgi:transcription-repair coupling factor (superfamily II helicase)
MSYSIFEIIQNTRNQFTQIVGAQGLAIAHTACVFSIKKPVIFVAPNPSAAEDFLRDIRFLFGEEHMQAVLYLPADEKTPYHATSPDPVLVGERLATLHKLATQTLFSVLVTSTKALATRTIPLESLQEAAEIIELKGEIHRDDLIKKIELLGYNRVSTVEDPGTFAVRGSIIDIFWPGHPFPVRIDLFGDEVERINTFDPGSQRTVASLEEYQFGAVREIQLNDTTVVFGEKHLRKLADDLNYPTKRLREKLEDLTNHIPFFGIESLLPAFFKELQSPLQLLLRVYGTDAFHIVINEPLEFSNGIRTLHQEYLDHYDATIMRSDLCFQPSQFLLSENEVHHLIAKQNQLRLESFAIEEALMKNDSVLSVNSARTDTLRQDILRETTRTDIEIPNAHHLLDPLASQIRRLHADHISVFLPAASLGGTHRLRELLQPHGLNIRTLSSAPDMITPQIANFKFDNNVHAFTFVAKPETPESGAIFYDLKIAIFSENDIFGKRARRQGKTVKKGGFRTTLADLKEGDPIVHVDHGVGIFKGLTRLNVRGVEQDYLLLVYQGNDKLYLPVHRINLIQTYSGAEGEPRLDKLGGTGWQTKKKKVKEAVIAMAQDLLNLYAKRELAKRPKSSTPDANYWEFEARFAFETTLDQQKAIDDVLSDMQKDKPMDRLVCGDVGYGKTEVAMRAAMMTVLNGRQVAVLAPTTILAQQHGITFAERFKDFGVRIAVVSRFQKSQEIKEAIQRTSDGKVDILIGTHRILSTDIAFKNLGLVVIDEEQRFGIKHKEHLKKLKSQTDALTLSATPIPRTLQMGFFGIRDLSIIETPPTDRRAIRTSIVRFDDAVIREAILMELGRGGQVYFVHNKVSSINAKADYLRNLVPEAKIEVGHGQMEESVLEQIMVRFMKHDFNILVCTTIIETGIDVSAANTMFIENADDFGLAQLYQLRGRIGRSKERAFAYLLIPAETEQLTPIAKKRLEILHRFSELGAGFRIAQHDLELRGAGDLLGKNQHGHIAAVGYDLYSELLKEAVEELKGRVHEEIFDPDINIPVAALIPEKYIPDLHDRMGYYQRLATAQNANDIWDVVGAMNDQCGETPAEVNNLAEVMIIKQMLKTLAIRGLDFVKADEKQLLPRVVLTLADTPKLDANRLMTWIKVNPSQVTLTPKMKLIYTPSIEEWQIANNHSIFSLSKVVIKQLQEHAAVIS